MLRFCATEQCGHLHILLNLPSIYNVYFPQEVSIKIMSLSTQLPHTILSSSEKFSGVHSIFHSIFYPANFFVLISLFVVPFFLQCLSPNIPSSVLQFCLFYSSIKHTSKEKSNLILQSFYGAFLSFC
jgi:hypothetical protein